VEVAQLRVVADLLLEMVYQVGGGGNFALLGAAELADSRLGFMLAGLLRPAAGIRLEGGDGLRQAAGTGVDDAPAVYQVRVIGAVPPGLVQRGQGLVVAFQGQVASSQVLMGLPAILGLAGQFQEAP
jgi:hypothetical protein